MSNDADLADLNARIKKAESDLDFWRAAGNQEKYLQSYFLADALEAQRDRWRADHERATALAVRRSAEPARAIPASREELMTRYSIAYSGQEYVYDGYHYDKLEDAVAYAKLGRPLGEDTGRQISRWNATNPPDEAQRQLMSEYKITFDGKYHLGQYRYERLDDALSYARLRRIKPAGP